MLNVTIAHLWHWGFAEMKRQNDSSFVQAHKRGSAAHTAEFNCTAMRIFILAPNLGDTIKTSEFWTHMQQEPMVSGIHLVPPLLLTPVKDPWTGEYAPSEIYLQHCFSWEAWNNLTAPLRR